MRQELGKKFNLTITKKDLIDKITEERNLLAQKKKPANQVNVINTSDLITMRWGG